LYRRRDSNPGPEAHETSKITPDRGSDGESESYRSETAPDVLEHVATSENTLSAAELAAAIARLTRRMATAGDEEIGELVAERKAMRAELAAWQQSHLPGNVIQLAKKKSTERLRSS
jgi:hypothetical protein